MKLKVQHVMDATLVVTNLINRQCPMPQRGKYLLARMHMKLNAEYVPINERRDEMIKAYNNPQMRPVPNAVVAEGEPIPMERVSNEWEVPADKMPEFLAAWKVIADEEIDVDIQPIPLISLCMPNGTEGLIEASEFITLGDLVVDTSN